MSEEVTVNVEFEAGLLPGRSVHMLAALSLATYAYSGIRHTFICKTFIINALYNSLWHTCVLKR